MSAKPILSIVIVNWNTRDLLLEVLAQLFDEPRMPFEVIVVDNDSSDDSVTATQERFAATRVLPQTTNGGFAFGVNRGLEAASGNWILLLNTDADADWAQLERFVREADGETDAAVFGPGIVDEHGNVQRSTWQRHLPRHYLPSALFLGRLFEASPRAVMGDVDCVSGCVFLIRRSVLPLVGGFDERFFMYFEEADFCERVRRTGHAVRYLPASRFLHVGGLSAAQSAERTFVAFRESTLLYHVAWHGRLWTEYVRLCLVLGHTLRLLIWCLLAIVGKGARARLYFTALRQLLRPGYIAELARRPRQVPSFDPLPDQP